MQNNGVKFKIFLMSFLLAMIFILPIFVFAEYTFLEKIPDYKKPAPGESQLTAYLTALFNYAIAVAAILAVIMIVIGGLQYIGAAGNTSVIEDAKDRIYWAVVGLFLALGSWMILFNINPELKELELKGVGIQTIEEKEKEKEKEALVNCRDVSTSQCKSYDECQLFITDAGDICGQKTEISTNKKCEDYGTLGCPCPDAKTEEACTNFKGCELQSFFGVDKCGAK